MLSAYMDNKTSFVRNLRYCNTGAFGMELRPCIAEIILHILGVSPLEHHSNDSGGTYTV